MKGGSDGLCSPEELLQKLLSNGTLKTEDVAAIQLEMNISKVKKVHHYSIFQRKDGRFTTNFIKGNLKKQVTGKTETELYEKLYRLYFPEDETTLAQLFERWMVYRRDNTAVKQKTLQESKNEWKKFFADSELATMAVNTIKPVTIMRFFRKLTKDRQYTQKRISNARSVLNGVFGFAIEEELIEHNPVSEVNFKQFTYKAVDNQGDVFSIEDAVKLLTCLENILEPYALAIRLDFNLLIRVGELKALRWEDVDWEENTIYIRRQCLIERQMDDNLNFSARTTFISEQMKGYSSNGFRKQPLTPEAVRILKLAKELNPTGVYIFMPSDRLMTTDSFNRRLKKYCREAGVEYHSSHKIRFFAASSAFTGSNLTTVSRLMGHSNVQTTMHYLRDICKGDDAIDAVAQLGLENNLEKMKQQKQHAAVIPLTNTGNAQKDGKGA